MKITFDIENEAECGEAVGMLLALQGEFRRAIGDLAAVTPARPAAAAPKRRRSRAGAANGKRPPPVISEARPVRHDELTPDQIALGAVAPEVTPVVTIVEAVLDPAVVVEEDIKVTRAKLRTKAQQLGVLWLRPALAARGVEKLSDLADQHVRELLMEHDDAAAS